MNLLEKETGNEQQTKTYRQEYRDSTPRWYRGELHLGFTLIFTFGAIFYCWRQLQSPTAWEWMLLIPMFLFGNYIEWAAHRYILHRPVKGLRTVYQRHVNSHHRFLPMMICPSRTRRIGGRYCFLHSLQSCLC